MNLQYRIDLLTRLGEYMLSDEPAWISVKERAFHENSWFIPGFIDIACRNIAEKFLDRDALNAWIRSANTGHAKKVGIVMAGNIPLVGFHDWLCVFISGHFAQVKLSSKDKVLIHHLTDRIDEWGSGNASQTAYSDMLRNCDAYIATGSNNSSRYFEYYFRKYAHIIRRNRTSVALLTGEETNTELEKLADDIHLYFGTGCRNVTKILVPANYDFVNLLEVFRKYTWMADHNKYKNNYDYILALHILNKKYYMTNGSILLAEDPRLFSPISQLNYEFYDDPDQAAEKTLKEPELQCLVGRNFLPFGEAQNPTLADWADGVDTLAFLSAI
jgi:hypothetical protein